MIKERIYELYNSRNILKALVVKNLVGRYKNTIIGFTWNFINPLVLMLVYYVVFTQLRSSDIPNFWVYMSSALFPLSFMTTNLTAGAGCIVGSSDMVKKIYFPREIIVISQVISSFIVALIGLSVVLVITICIGFDLTGYVLLLPLFLLITFIFTLGYTFAVSALTVYIRDIQHLLSTLIVLVYFTTPTYLLLNNATGTLSILLKINPFTYYVELFHHAIYFGTLPSVSILVGCTLFAGIILVVGFEIFNKLKRGFVERL